MALHVFAATSGNFWEAPRAAIAVKKKRSIGVNGVVATLSLYGSESNTPIAAAAA